MELLRGQRPATLLPTRAEKQHNQMVQAIVFEAKENALHGDASAALTSRAMEQTVDLFKYGRSLAGDNPQLAAELDGYVATFIDSSKRRLRTFDSGFKL